MPTVAPDVVIQKNTGGSLVLEPMAQVILYNDDVNTFDHVVEALVKVFGHTKELSEKLAMEAHNKGKVVAEVEGLSEAVLHKEQLQSYGLTVDVERI